ncbi:MAG TPA: P1 family peptidase [Steroidobacteraceae bacterium]|nr:P1 family peptidase [Steroidobacteraceae bacterium]
MSPGPLNAITDVPGVLVGQVTLIDGSDIRTGVTAILPHGGNIHSQKVPAGFAVGNGYGKFAGSTQIEELGEIESPVVLTNTLAVGAAMEGVVRWTLRQPGNERVRSVNAVVGETNDGILNDIRALAVRPEHVLRALEAAAGGPVAEGSVGAGTGTQAFGWKGGIGTSSRRVPLAGEEYCVGALVQTNFGGILSIAGAPVGRALGGKELPDESLLLGADGSIVIVIATDAPLSDRNLSRMARRAFLGLGRTGSPMTNGSGDYSVAFSTAPSVRRCRAATARTASTAEIANDAMSYLFLAVVEATEEAIYNALFCARGMSGHRGTLDALPRERALEILRHHRLLADWPA